MKNEHLNLIKKTALITGLIIQRIALCLFKKKTTVFRFFNACHADKAAAASANALHSSEVEYPMTLNDLSLLCESVAKALDVPGGVKYEITTEPVVDGEYD
uniref:hypothetical protein n=1 Tax=Escherichia coli TaxID=562 RepID=UPI001F257347|nr:hypothetical protein [Escherichia coli]UGK56445.1 hypothetical protein [Escherichia coli]